MQPLKMSVLLKKEVTVENRPCLEMSCNFPLERKYFLDWPLRCNLYVTRKWDRYAHLFHNAGGVCELFEYQYQARALAFFLSVTLFHLLIQASYDFRF